MTDVPYSPGWCHRKLEKLLTVEMRFKVGRSSRVVRVMRFFVERDQSTLFGSLARPYSHDPHQEAKLQMYGGEQLEFVCHQGTEGLP